MEGNRTRDIQLDQSNYMEGIKPDSNPIDS